MSDFVSGFWSGYVALLTIVSIGGCAALLVIMSRARAKPSEAQDAAGSDTTGHVWDGDLAEYNNPLPKWWLNLFWITLLFAVAYLVLFPGLGNMPGLLHWSSAGAYGQERHEIDARVQPLFDRYAKTDVPALAADPEARAMGERLFLNYCAQCHGSAAKGGKTFPDLTDTDWLYGGTPQTITATITDGRNGVMPAFGKVLGGEGVKDVTAYVRSLSKLPHDDLRAQLGKPLFMQNCAACHGADGKGNQAVGAPNLTDEVWLYGSSEATIIEGVTNGHHVDASEGSHAMPAFKDTLGEGRIHLLTAYVWGLSNRPSRR